MIVGTYSQRPAFSTTFEQELPSSKASCAAAFGIGIEGRLQCSHKRWLCPPRGVVEVLELEGVRAEVEELVHVRLREVALLAVRVVLGVFEAVPGGPARQAARSPTAQTLAQRGLL